MNLTHARTDHRGFLLAALAVVITLLAGLPTLAHDDSQPHGGRPPPHAQDAMRAFASDHHHDQQLAAQSITSCSGGMAGSYPCSNVDLLAFIPLSQLGGGNGTDIWGWTDPGSGREFAIMGTTQGVSFVEITDPVNPVYLGHLPRPAGVATSSWSDVKVYDGHAFIGTEAIGAGLQVMDLGQLLSVAAPPVTFAQAAHYTGFSTSHNIVVNTDTAYIYAVGTNNGNCGRGLHIVDVLVPASPVFAGCYGGDGYTHDAQCVLYHGPDAEHQGREICFAYNEDTLTIVDVSDKSAPVQLSRTPYADEFYTHQGWLTEDQAWLLMDDELDEIDGGFTHTRTLIWDVSDLDAPVHTADYSGVATSIDHNQYIVGQHAFQANYTSGLRVLDISGIAAGSLAEIGFFDIYPANDGTSFNGAWSVYPFFASGNVVVSGIEQGLYVLRPNLTPGFDAPEVTVVSPPDGAADLAGVVAVAIDASDLEDPAGSLLVEYRIDGGAWSPTAWDGSRYVADWNTAGVADGVHTLTARAIDSDLREAEDRVNVTTSNGSPTFVQDSVNVTIEPGKGNRNRAHAMLTVLDENGSPVEGVLVEGAFTGDWSGARSATTGPDGQAQVSTPRVKNLAYAQYCVSQASKDGWTFDVAGSTLCGDSSGAGGAFGTLEGLVTDAATAAPIAGAGVSTDTGQSGSTDASGSYVIGGVPVGVRTLTATANGYSPATRTATVNDGAVSQADFALNAEPTGGAGAIRGTVHDSSGSKLAGVLVDVQGGSSATTNKGGKYHIQNLAAGQRTVTASLAGYLSQTRVIEVLAGTTVTTDFTLQPE